MGKIKTLDPDVVLKIAAGEVVERPASVVKELIENALDAQADRIEIELEKGGLERILVSDNGEGIAVNDLPLAVVSHATSKFREIGDFERLATFGFRGEALAGIAAVSKFELLTRTGGALVGARLTESGIAEAGAPKGTRIVVLDLFYNVAARRKFLKSVQAEEAAAMDVITKLALSHPDVTFQVSKNGKHLFTLTAGESLKGRYLKLFPQIEREQIFEFESLRGNRKVHGLIGGPSCAKSSRNGIFFYVNKRSVRPGFFSQAILDGYAGYLQPGKFPIAVVFLEVEGSAVDVNVHPTKAEVRFSSTKEIYGLIQSAVSSALAGLGEETRPHAAPFYAPETSSEAYRVTGAGRFPQAGARYEDLSLFEKPAPYGAADKQAVLLGTIAKTYAIFQDEQTLFLVDLHVAHERINFDLLESRRTNGSRPSQELLTPYLIELGAAQISRLSNHSEFLKNMGLVLENFGSASVRVTAVPSGFEKLGEKKMLLSFLDKLEKIDEIKEPEARTYKMLAAMACRASIQAGDDVSRYEIESLFPKLLKSSNPYFCPHGRPIIIKFTLDEIHDLFKRSWSKSLP